MTKADKRQRQKARRAAAEAARRRAELRKRRTRAGVILGAAVLGIAVLLGAVYFGSRKSDSGESAAPTGTPPPPVGEGISCATPAPPNPREYPGIGPMKVAWDSRDYVATMKTNYGPIEIELFTQDAPITVNNFVSLACDGYYNDTDFHRVAASPELSVIQGGYATAGDGTGSPGYSIPDELSRAKQDGYKRGAVAMANSGPDSAGSQFFIVVKDSFLPPNYALFGKVVLGMEVVDTMFAEGNPGPSGDGPPGKPLTIESVAIAERPAGGNPVPGAPAPEAPDGAQG